MKKKSEPRKFPYNNVRQLRLAAKLTLERLAERIEPPTSYDMVQKLETGARELRRDWIKKIAIALHKEESDIIIADKNGNFPVTSSTSANYNTDRKKLNTAIKLWRYEEDGESIHSLASDAYKGIHKTNQDITNKSTEGLLVSCIVKLRREGIDLNNLEFSFLLWVAANKPILIKNEAREFYSKFLKGKGINNIREFTRDRLFGLIGNIRE